MTASDLEPARVSSPLLARLLSSIFIVLIVFAASRAMIRALPGDPLDTLVAESGVTLPVAELRKELGLDRPYWSALREDAFRAVQGDLGVSLISREPIAPLLARRFLATVQLTLVALLLSAVFSLSLGIAAARNRGGLADRLCTSVGAIAAALPSPWTGSLLIVIFAVVVPIFTIDQSVALPALTLALSFSGFWARVIRERVRETLERGSAQGARARGIPEWKVALKYGLAPCGGALAAYLGTQIGGLLGGAFVTEVVFGWPGLGSLLVDAVLKRDYPLVESAIFIGALCSVVGTLLGDWMQSRIDPRTRSA